MVLPLCAAKYKVFIKADEDKLEEIKFLLKNMIKNAKLEVPLQLGDEQASIRFTEKHLIDIRPSIEYS